MGRSGRGVSLVLFYFIVVVVVFFGFFFVFCFTSWSMQESSAEQTRLSTSLLVTSRLAHKLSTSSIKTILGAL